MRSVLLTIGIVVFLMVPAVARADLPPPDGYVEQCTTEKQQQPGETCQSCSTYFGEPNKCSDLWGKQNYQKKCQTAGASTWGELWCKTESGVPIAPVKSSAVIEPKEKTAGGCAVDPAASWGGVWFVLSLGAVFWLSSRRSSL